MTKPTTASYYAIASKFTPNLFPDGEPSRVSPRFARYTYAVRWCNTVEAIELALGHSVFTCIHPSTLPPDELGR